MFQVSYAFALKTRRRGSAFVAPSEMQRRHQARIAIDFAVSRVFGIEPLALRHGTRGGKDIASARQVAMYLAHVCCGLTLTEVGAMFGRDRTTVAHGCLKVEYRRDDPTFDRAIDLLSWSLPTLVTRTDLRCLAALTATRNACASQRII